MNYVNHRHMEDDETEKLLTLLAGRFREIRMSQGLSMNRLAAMAGLDQVAISRIEKGERRPSLATALRICKALGINLSDELRKIDH